MLKTPIVLLLCSNYDQNAYCSIDELVDFVYIPTALFMKFRKNAVNTIMTS